MSGDGGYVAADALSALAIVGLAVGGLTAGLFTLGRSERAAAVATAAAVDTRTARGEFSRLLRDRGPFRSDAPAGDGLVGGLDRLAFRCGARECAAQLTPQGLSVQGADGVRRALRLPGGGARLSYVSPLGSGPVWPPTPPPPAPTWTRLAAVVVEDSAGRPLLVARLDVQEPRDCEFDVVIQDCRKTSP